MKKEVTILITTYNRPEGLKRLLDSIEKNTKDTTYDLLVVVDNDDLTSYNYCLERNLKCILSGFHRDFVAQMNMAIYACETPYFVILGDDIDIQQENWLGEALKIFKEKFPDGVGLMSFNDGIQGGRMFATGMSSKRFVYKVGGYLYCPRFVHYGADNVVSFLAKQLNCYHYAESVKVIHYHPTNKDENFRGKDDKTYQISKQFMHNDQAIKKKMKSDVEKLKKTRNYHDYF